MLIRQPSLLDMIHVSELLIPGSENASEQAEFATEWASKAREDNFWSFVALDKKKIVGWITGSITEEQVLDIGFFRGETPEVLDLLWKKVQKEFEPVSASLTTNDPDTFIALQFEPVVTVMCYHKETVSPEMKKEVV